MFQEDLLQEAQIKGIKMLALTDINTTSGLLDFFRLAPKYHIKAIAGIDFRNGAQRCYIGIAKSQQGFHHLNEFLSNHLSNKEPFPERAPKLEDVFFIYSFDKAISIARFKNQNPVFTENEFVGLRPSELYRLQNSPLKFFTQKLLVLQTVSFRNKTDFNTHRLLRAIKKNTLLSKLALEEQADMAEIMPYASQIIEGYKECPHIIYNTEKLMEQCYIDFEFGKNKNRKFYLSTAHDDYNLLLKICHENLSYRYPNQSDAVMQRLNKEIEAITTQGYTSYFLINWDIVRYAQSKNYYYIGRGSGANSLVAYLLRITDVDPIDLDLYFERFINASRTSPPDFDIDFSWTDRDDVTDYIFNRSSFGQKNAALLATYNTFQPDSVLRELGKVFGLPPSEIDALQAKGAMAAKKDNIASLIEKYSRYIQNLPNHLSVHAGGILISEKPMTFYTALENPPKGYPLTQFSMLEAEDLGLYKFDILSQRGLAKIKDAVELVKQNRNIELDMHNVSHFKTDEKVRQNLQSACLIGCFYVESPAMRTLLKKLRASTYLDLVAASSIIRPGVSQSGMMREYILRFHDPARRGYAHPVLKELMEETYGVMVYQEDVIKVAHYFAQLSLTEADMLRRGMSGKYRGRDEFKKVEEKFFFNCKKIGYSDAVTKEVWRQIESFAGYAFSKGHSASYAVESYQCMFLKTYFPLEYLVAVINNGGGFYSTALYVHEARLCGAEIYAPDVNMSEWGTCIKGCDIYLGFDRIHELEVKTGEALIKERNKGGKFLSLFNFMQRVQLPLDQLRLLIRANAFRFTGRTKQQLLWDIHMQPQTSKTMGLTDLFEKETINYQLPALTHSSVDDAWDEIELFGFSLCSPFELLKNYPEIEGAHNRVSDIHQYLGKCFSITGYLITRKRVRTKQGKEMAFGTFIDVDGQWLDTVHFPEVLKKFPFSGNSCYRITGIVVEEFGVYSIEVREMKKLEFKERFSNSALANKLPLAS